jgi:quinoprotein glucose dehydrogenase
MPRIVVFAVLGLVLLIPSVRRGLIWRFPTPSFGMFIGAIAAAMIVGVALHANVPPTVPIDPVYQAGTIAIPAGPTASRHAEWADGDWRHYGNDPGGTRFSALAQITPTIIMLLS